MPDTKLSKQCRNENRALGLQGPSSDSYIQPASHFTFLVEDVGRESVPPLRATRPRKTQMYGATGLLLWPYIFKALKHQEWKGQSRGDTCRGLHPMTPVSRATTFRTLKTSWVKPFSAVSQKHTGGTKRISRVARQELAQRTKGI